MLACGPRPSGKPYVASCTGCVRLIVDQHGNASGLGHDLVHKGKSLRDDLMDEEIDACHVTARPTTRPSLTGSSPTPNKIGIVAVAALAARAPGAKPGRGDQGHVAADQVRHQPRHAVVLATHPVLFDRDVASLEVAHFVQTPCGTRSRCPLMHRLSSR
jgi:hypothetical protein